MRKTWSVVLQVFLFVCGFPVTQLNRSAFYSKIEEISREWRCSFLQDKYKVLVEEATEQCKDIFGDKLIATYLHGSIAQNDAVPYVSDLDYYVVVCEDISQTTHDRISEAESYLQHRYPFVNGIHLSVHSVEELRRDSFARFVLKYNSLLYAGRDIVKEIDVDEIDVLKPNKRMAKDRLNFAKKCFEDALGGKQPMCTGEIPDNTYYAARKFARYFVIIEGAYFLMSQDKFSSFLKDDVLADLYKSCSVFQTELNMVQNVLNDPVSAGIEHHEFLERISPFVQWMFKEIERS